MALMKNKVTLSLILIFLSFQGASSKDYNLKEIIEIGLKHNPYLLARREEVEAAKFGLEAAKRFFNPSLDFKLGKANSYEGILKKTTNGISISQSLENPLKRQYRIQMHEDKFQQAQFSYENYKLEIIHEIKHSFFKIILFENRVDLARKSLESIQNIHQLILKRVQLGETKELEAIKLQVETLKAKNELNRNLKELKLARENLNKLLGNILSPDFSVEGELDYKPIEIDEAGLIEKALISHPLIKGKQKEQEHALSNYNYLKWGRIPDALLSGFIDEELEGRNKGVGISIEIPLWNFKSNEIAEAKSLFLKESEELKAIKMELETEIKTKLNELKLSEEMLNLFLAGLLEQAIESLKISEVSYKQGEISLIDYLDSQRTYYSILKEYQDSLFAWNANKAALERAIGGEIK